MKKSVLFFLFALGTMVFAQEGKEDEKIVDASMAKEEVKQTTPVNMPKTTFGFEAMSMATSTFTLEFEHRLLANGGLYIAGGPTLRSTSNDELYGAKGEAQFRAYFFEHPHKYFSTSFYLAPFFRYHYLQEKDYSYSYSGTTETRVLDGTYDYHTFMGGIVFGFKAYIINKLYFDASVGGGMRYSSNNNSINSIDFGPFDFSQSGIFPRLNFGVGIAL